MSSARNTSATSVGLTESTIPANAINALTLAQRRALQHIRSRANAQRTKMRAALVDMLTAAGAQATDLDGVISSIQKHARVTLNFHPDRLLADGRSVAEALLEDGIYRNQFETQISNGGRTAYPGGDRDVWEEALFGAAYQEAAMGNDERAKYGAFNLMSHVDGAAPRFGSCYFRLGGEVSKRTTYCFGDSHADPTHVGTLDAFESVLFALFHAVATEGEALGVRGIDVAWMLDRLLTLEERLEDDPAEGVVSRALDHYIEGQIHGDVYLARDTEILVVDPAFRGTPTESVLRAISDRYQVALFWHPGFSIAVKDVPDSFRGPAMPPLAQRVDKLFGNETGRIDVATLGRAAASVNRHPEQWTDWGSVEETLQHLKQLWHVMVQFGQSGQ